MSELLILPSLKVGGGVFEALKYFDSQGSDNRTIFCMWKSEDQVVLHDVDIVYATDFFANKKWAFLQLPFILFSFVKFFFGRENKKYQKVYFTHYTTLLFFPFVKRGERYLLLQGEEWRFLGDGFFGSFFSSVILFYYRKMKIISFSPTLTQALNDFSIVEYGRNYIWADKIFSSYRSDVPLEFRKNDIVLMLRRGFAKRPDLTKLCLAKIRSLYSNFKVCVVTSDSEYYNQLIEDNITVFYCPSRNEIAKLFSDSKVFILLSETEGFGLPPLEAMAAGCVPVCRDSGGPRLYLRGELSELLFSLEASVDTILDFVNKIINDADKLERYSQLCIEVYEEGVI